MKTAKKLSCSFCGKSQDVVKKLISANENLYICDECIELCNDILLEEGLAKAESKGNQSDKSHTTALEPKNELQFRLKKPQEIYAGLSKFVVGQRSAKKSVSVATYKHYHRAYVQRLKDLKLEKENILLIGPTGSGKTLIAKTLATITQVPFAFADATALTESGYVGEDVETMLAYLLKAAGGNLEQAQNGVVFIDEIDKIARKKESLSITRDVSGEGVQQGLLGMLGGSIVHVDPTNKRKHPDSTYTDIDTSNILFICGGSFEGIERIVYERLKRTGQLGILPAKSAASQLSDLLRSKINADDLIEYGFLPEFAARFSTITHLSSLRELDIVRLLKGDNSNVIQEYKELFKLKNIELVVEDDALYALAKLVVQEKIGARGIKAILDRILLDTIFSALENPNIRICKLDKSVIELGINPKLFDSYNKPVEIRHDKVFVSYAREDAGSVEELQNALTPYLHDGTIETWYDGMLKPSSEWKREIDAAMATSKIALFLVSQAFLDSSFATKEEMSYFLGLGESIKILWVLIDHCDYNKLGFEKYQAVHDISIPIKMLEPEDRQRFWLKICNEIYLALDT